MFVKALWSKPERWRWPHSEEVWSASILTMIRHHGECRIFTDDLGARWIRALQIPGMRQEWVSLLLNDIRYCDPWTWHLGKLYLNNQMRESFIQTDGDVILGRPLPNRILGAEVCAERLYHMLPLRWMDGCHLSDKWRNDLKKGRALSFNCGLFGGRNIEAIRRISSAGLDFIAKNVAHLKSTGAPRDNACIASEEWAIAREFDGYEVSCLTVMGDEGTKHMRNCGRAYLHLAGKSKTAPERIARVREIINELAPGHLRRCQEVARSFFG